MSTETIYALNLQAVRPRPDARNVRSLCPAVPQSTPAARGRLSASTLALVILLHVGLFYLALARQTTPPAIATPETPMMVSLVENPAPELKAPEPTPPEPKLVVRKVTPAPKKPEPRPEPKPEVVEPTPAPPVIAPEPVKVAEQVAQPEPPKQEVVKAPEPPKEEPVIEPKFGAAYLKNPPPDYPTLSRRIGEQGRVLLRVLVSEQGAPQSVELESGSGFNRLDKAAMDAVKKWRFIPARKGSQAISAYVLVPLKFSLDG